MRPIVVLQMHELFQKQLAQTIPCMDEIIDSLLVVIINYLLDNYINSITYVQMRGWDSTKIDI